MQEAQALQSLSQEDFAIVKLAAAQTYAAHNMHPDTASYLFDRKMAKVAKACGAVTEAKPVVAKVTTAKPVAKVTKITKVTKPADKTAAAKAPAKAADLKMAKIAGLADNLKKVLAKGDADKAAKQ